MSTVNAGWRGPNIVKEGLVLYLDAASGTSYSPYTSGVTWRDISGNGNNGTLTNGASYNSANGGSFTFDGVDDYTYIANGYTNALKNNNNWSVSIWFRANNLGNNPVLLSPDTGQLAYFDLFLEVGNNAVYFAAGGGAGGGYLQNTSTTLQINNIYNIYYIKTGITTGKVYINGNEISLTAFGTGLGSMPNSNADLRLGAFKEGSYFLNGNIYNTLIYNRTLLAIEVLQNFNAQKSRFNL